MSTPRGNVPITTYVIMPNGTIFYNNEKIFPKLDYVIKFQNDSSSKKFTYIEVNDSIYRIQEKIKGEKKIILPWDKKSLTYTSSVTKIDYKGMPTDSCWLFKTKKGKINTYSYLMDEDWM